MLGTPEIAKVARAFIRACQTAVDAAQERVPRLGCLSWDENVVHRKRLRWLGFEASSIKHNGFTCWSGAPCPPGPCTEAKLPYRHLNSPALAESHPFTFPIQSGWLVCPTRTP